MDQVTHFLFLTALILVIIFTSMMLSGMSCFKGWMKKEGKQIKNFYDKVDKKVEKIPGKIEKSNCNACQYVNTNYRVIGSGDNSPPTVGTATYWNPKNTSYTITDDIWYHTNCKDEDGMSKYGNNKDVVDSLDCSNLESSV